MAGANPEYATGQDMTNLEIVRNFVEQGSKAQMVAATREFTRGYRQEHHVVMLGHLQPSTKFELGRRRAKTARRSL